MFQSGDRVRHAGKPQWGVGRVERAERVTHAGQAVQRVVVSFPNHGRVTLNTAFAPLQAADPVARSQEAGESMSPVAPLSASLEALKSLPSAATDPLSTLSARLRATLDLYQHSTDARSLLDWAVAQTQLDDPLSHFSRHELERAFADFAHARDRHLRELARAIRKAGKQELLDEALRHPDRTVRDAVAQAVRSL